MLVAGLLLGFALGWHRFLTLDLLAERRDALRFKVADHYLLTLAGFMIAYIAAVAFSFPAASVLTIGAGFLFGWIVGGCAVVISATIGATLVFLAARSAFGDSLCARLGGKAEAFAAGFERDAFSYLLVLRIAPIFPFFLVNIAPAIFNVRLGSFVGATLLGIIPGTFAYAFLGDGIDDLLLAARETGTTISLRDIVNPKITLAFVLLAIVAAIPAILKARRKYGKRTRGER